MPEKDYSLTSQAPNSENAGLYARLKESERKYRSIFENALEGIFQSTPDGCLISANPALAGIHGYDSPEEFLLWKTAQAKEFMIPRYLIQLYWKQNWSVLTGHLTKQIGNHCAGVS